MKLIVLIVGLALGFGGGILFSKYQPQAASDLAAKQEEWLTRGKMEATEAIKQRLDQILDKQKASPAGALGFTGSSSLLGGGGSSSTDAIKQLRDEQDQALKSMADKVGKK